MVSLDKDQVQELRQVAMQFFAENKVMREHFESEIKQARLGFGFQDAELNAAMGREYIAAVTGIGIGSLLPSHLMRLARARRLRYLGYIKAWADRQTRDIAGTVTERYTATPASPELSNISVAVMTQAALIDEYKFRWPTIRSDLNQASKNGLSAVAKPDSGSRGWVVEKALAWAKSRNKLKQQTKAVSSVFERS